MRNSGKSVRRDVAAAKGRQRPVSKRPALKKLSQGGTRKVSEGVKKKKKKKKNGTAQEEVCCKAQVFPRLRDA